MKKFKLVNVPKTGIVLESGALGRVPLDETLTDAVAKQLYDHDEAGTGARQYLRPVDVPPPTAQATTAKP